MKLKALVMGAVTAAFLAIPTIAMAAWGNVTGDVNMRTGPGTNYSRITVLPAGARVWVNGSAGNGWVSVTYNGSNGYVSGSYVATGYADARPIVRPPLAHPPLFRPPMFHRPPAPTYGYYHKPWWDQRRQAWYDGRRWYRNGVWYNDPSGLSFGFSFGG